MSATLSKTATKPARYGMTIDLDRCTGCGACMIACAVENNVPPARPEATPRTGITWMRVYQISNGAPFPDSRAAFIPILCQHPEGISYERDIIQNGNQTGALRIMSRS